MKGRNLPYPLLGGHSLQYVGGRRSGSTIRTAFFFHHALKHLVGVNMSVFNSLFHLNQLKSLSRLFSSQTRVSRIYILFFSFGRQSYMRIEAICLTVSEKTIHIINNKDTVGIKKEK